jgi:hypothetical protein
MKLLLLAPPEKDQLDRLALTLMRFLLFLSLCFLLPVLTYGADCTILAKMQHVQIRDCGIRALEVLGKSNEVLSTEPYSETPVGLERFWSAHCNCQLWQVVGLTGTHTRVARIYREGDAGTLKAIPGGEFSSDAGLIARFDTTAGLFMETQEADAGGQHKLRNLYRFDGSRFVALRRAQFEERSR